VHAEQPFAVVLGTQAKEMEVLGHFGSSEACESALRTAAIRRGMSPEKAPGPGGAFYTLGGANGGIPVAVMTCDHSGSKFWNTEIKAGRAKGKID